MSHPADNLYSADGGSDTESFSDELSPSDGYFNRSEAHPHSMVIDPSIDSKVEDKTLIPPPNVRPSAGQSSRTSIHSLHPQSPPSQNYASRHASRSGPPSQASYTPALPPSAEQNADMISERSALINGPPPAYTPNPTSPTTSQSTAPIPNTPQEQVADRSYNTFSEQQSERRPPSRHDPQSMGQPIDMPPSERTPLAAGPPKATQRRKIIQKVLFAALVLAIVTAIMTSAFHHGSSDRNKLPVGDWPDWPGDGHFDDDRPIDSEEPYCPAAKYKEAKAVYEFPVGDDLSILQTNYGEQDTKGMVMVSTMGEIQLRRLPKDSEHGNHAYFTVAVHVSDPSLEVIKTWDESARRLIISTPRWARLNGNGHCISLAITAWFPEGASFKDLVIESIALRQRVLPDIKIDVTGQARFGALSGSVMFPRTTAAGKNVDLQPNEAEWRSSGSAYPFNSRKISVETMSGSISGTFPLMDYLALSSHSGNIKADAIPQPVLREAPKPADLEVQTSSGSILVACPVEAELPPPRNYITRVHSTSGGIRGSYYIGSLSNFKTASGSIQFTGLPVFQAQSDLSVLGSNTPNTPNTPNAPNSPNRLTSTNIFETHTISGTTKITLLDPMFIDFLTQNFSDRDIFTTAVYSTADKSAKVRNLKSVHQASSGSMNVHYPAAWEGSIYAKTVSGSITAVGDGVRIVKHRKGPAYQELVARKGVDDEGEGSLVDMLGISGSLHFTVGL